MKLSGFILFFDWNLFLVNVKIIFNNEQRYIMESKPFHLNKFFKKGNICRIFNSLIVISPEIPATFPYFPENISFSLRN
ncbi:hypothetical protein AM232_00930 [Bacillus sp. FJAT-21352]|nr:hypothetical protein AM232_00930 [Bacillus sp. FJAT-21352]